jgi:signal transduction histidine kinase
MDASAEARLLRRVERERAARKQAEALLEAKSLELYESAEALRNLAMALEQRIEQRTAELRAALELANAAQRAKDQFLATMSHEIRTPMNAVIGLADLLRDTGLDARQLEYVQTLQASGRHLLALINDILDFSKIEAGRLELDPQPMALRESLDVVSTMTRPQAESRDLFLRFEVSPQVPARFVVDALRWRQVLINLVSNAIKFTEHGGVTVRIGLDDAHPEGARLHCEVEDTGIGITADAQRRIFEPFSQADASTTRTHGGTGLGLAISMRIVASLGGALTLRSTPGRGSTFRFDWPYVEARQPHASPEAVAAGTGRPLADLKVLLVEDNQVNQMVATAMLAKAGCAATLARDGIEAVEQAAAGGFDVILMDMQMPRLDGLGASRRIRELPLPTRPVIVALTANAFDEDRQRCIDAGMDDFLGKPLSYESLLEALRRAAARAA